MISRHSGHPSNGPGGSAEVLTAFSSDAVIATFAAYGVNLTLSTVNKRGGPRTRSLALLAREGGVEPPTLGAIVTFEGPRIRGDLLLASTFDLVAATRPGSTARFSALRDATKMVMMRDWIGELANQALGRLKSGLLGLNLSFETRAPKPLSAEAIAVITPRSPDAAPILLRAGGGGVGFWLDVQCDDDLGPGARASSPPSEGKVLLF